MYEGLEFDVGDGGVYAGNLGDGGLACEYDTGAAYVVQSAGLLCGAVVGLRGGMDLCITAAAAVVEVGVSEK